MNEHNKGKINKNTFLVMKAFSGSATIGERVPS